MDAGTTTRKAATPRLVTLPFVVLAAADLAYFTAAGVAVYLVPVYTTGPVGSDAAGSGLAFGAFGISALLLRPVAGRLCDRGGRLPLLVGGALLCAVSMAGTALVHSLVLVVALRLLLGVAEAAFFVASMAALVDLAPPSRMGEAVSYNSLGLYLGLTLGPPLGELLVGSVGFTAGWLAAAVLAVAAAALVLVLGETRADDASDGDPGALIHWPAVPIAVGFLAAVFAMGGFLAFSGLYADGLGLRATSLPLLVYGGTVVCCRIAFARLPDRVPPLTLGAAAVATMGGGLLLAAAWQAPAGLVLGGFATGLGISFCTPAFFRAIFATAGPSRRGAASATASVTLDLGIGGGPVVLGLVAAGQGIPAALAVAAAVAGAGSLWTGRLAARARLVAA